MPVPSPRGSGKSRGWLCSCVCPGPGHLAWSPMVGGFYPPVFFDQGLGGGGVLTGQRMGTGGWHGPSSGAALVTGCWAAWPSEGCGSACGSSGTATGPWCWQPLALRQRSFQAASRRSFSCTSHGCPMLCYRSFISCPCCLLVADPFIQDQDEGVLLWAPSSWPRQSLLGLRLGGGPGSVIIS